MNLHTKKEDFQDLCVLTSEYIEIPQDAAHWRDIKRRHKHIMGIFEKRCVSYNIMK